MMNTAMSGRAVSGTATAGATISATGIGYSIGRSQLLHDVDIELRAGEVLAVIGPNGAGKSTALAVLAGDLKPHAGVVSLGGTRLADIPLPRLSRMRSVLPQSTSVSFSYTVREVVAMGRLPWRSENIDADDGEIVDESLDRADIQSLAERDVTTLSGGEQARVAFARVLAQRCPIVLLDEPTAALDIGHQEEIMREAVGLARNGAAVMVVLHDLGLAAAHGDRVVVMDAGRVVASGPPAEVMTSELLSRIYRYPVEVTELSGELVIRPRRAESD